MADPTGGLPGGVDPSDPGMSNDSSLGADRAAAIEAEKKKWRDRNKKAAEPVLPTADETEKLVDHDEYFDE